MSEVKIALPGTTQRLVTGPRRAKTSRAFCSAISASAAWTLPACWCGAPGSAWRKTSQRSLSIVFLRVGLGGGAHPSAVGVGLLTGLQPLAVARAVAVDDGPEFFPIHITFGNLESHRFGLDRRHLDEALPEFVVAVQFDFPSQQLGAVG